MAECAPEAQMGVGRVAVALVAIARAIYAVGDGAAAAAEIGADRLRLARKVSLLSHLLEEIAGFTARGDGSSAAAAAEEAASSSTPSSSTAAAAIDPVARLEELLVALEAAKRLLLLGRAPPLPPLENASAYERFFIQRWIDCGNRTCPKTQQKLQNLTLTPNYVLRSLIMQWCEENGIEQPSRTTTGWIRKSDGSFQEVSGDRAAVEALVRNLSSLSLEERKSAAAEIRSLAKRSTDNRILLAEARAIPALVSLLSVQDQKTREHAVTSLLYLSIYIRQQQGTNSSRRRYSPYYPSP